MNKTRLSLTPSIFRAYDIRGNFPSEVNGETANLIGQAFGTWLARSRRETSDQSNPDKTKIIVGRDNRFSSDELSAKFIEGLAATGAEIIDIGLAVTPLVHFATIKYPVDAGVIVTASHNPKEFNGFRFDLKQAVPFYGEQIQTLRKIIEKADFEKGIGQVNYRDDVFNDYLADLKSRLKLPKGLKVVLDCANGAASKFAVKLFSQLGFSVTGLFCNLDGDFPHHQPDPEERINLKSLATKVIEEKADLGFGFDTDADRYGVVDEKGTPYENDKILILLARQILKKHPGSKIIFDIKSSYVLEQEIKKLGGQPVWLRTGHPYFRKYLKDNADVFLGGELSSHTFISDDYYGYDDGFYAAARVGQIVAESNKSLSSHFAGIPHTAHTEEIKIACVEGKKDEIVKLVGEELAAEGYVTNRLDGFRINFSQTAWVLIRASNTSPYISLRFETENKENLTRLVTLVKDKLSRFKELNLADLNQRLKEKAHNI